MSRHWWEEESESNSEIVPAAKGFDPEFIAAYQARQEEIRKNPACGRFDSEGHTPETQAKARLRAICQRLAGHPDEVKF